ncbi:hypothetical protein AAG906_014735 [Vitis piasezkii]
MSLRTQYDTTMKTLDDVKGSLHGKGTFGTTLQKLRELRNDVNRRVNVAERQQMRRLDQVQGWLSRVEAMETEVTQLIGDGAETIDEKGLCGSCYPKHCISCYKLGKKVVRKLQQVATLMSEGRLEVVADSVPPDSVEEIPSEPTVGLESTFDTVWRSLGEEHVGFCDDKWKIKSRHVKAKDIWKALSKRGLWCCWMTWGANGSSKLIFTTRSLDLCGQMGAQKKIKMKSLAWKDSWDLFKKYVGEDALNSDPEILSLLKLLQECCGLPQNQGFNIISTLVHACLLDETSDAYRVKLHDVIRDMAAGLTQAPEFHKWRMEERISLMANQIEKLMGSPTCPNLSTLLLDFNSDLKMISNDGNESLVEELDSLKYLTTLCTTIASAAVCTHALCLKIFNGSNSLNLSSPKYKASHLISFDWVGKGKEIVEYSNLSSMVECFHCLGTVHIYRCQMLKNLTWLIFAPNLLYLTIEECDNMEELIGKGAEDGGNLSPFTKLIRLQLFCLPQLKNRIVVGSCPKLKKLPLNSSSAKQHRCVIRGEEEWWNELEWEDEATLNAFLPCLKPHLNKEHRGMISACLQFLCIYQTKYDWNVYYSCK